MSSVTESVDVAVPLETAYNQWTQFEDFPRFMEGVERINQVDDTHTHWVIRVGGATREFDAEIKEQRPDERVAWASTGGPQHAGVVTFHRLDPKQTRVTVQMEVEPQGLTENVADHLGFLDRQVKGDLARFKTFIEDRRDPTGAWRGEVPRTPTAAGTGAAGATGPATDARTQGQTRTGRADDYVPERPVEPYTDVPDAPGGTTSRPPRPTPPTGGQPHPGVGF